MRVAMFADCYHPIINGVSTSIQLLARSLQDGGHEVLLFVPDVPGHADGEPWVRRFASVPFPLHAEDRVSFPWPLANLQEAVRFAPDVVHLHTPFNVGLFGWLVAARLGRARVFTHHTLFEEYLHYVPLPQGLMLPVALGISRWFWNTSAVVIAPSEEIRDRQVEQGVKSPLHVIPTGIDVESFRGGDPTGPRREIGLEPQDRVLLYIGRIAREKSLEVLLEVLDRARRQDPLLRLVLVGDGPERTALEDRAADMGLGDRVSFLGARPRLQLKHYLAAATCFVFASQTETQGLVLLEAQASGLPVVAVRASGASEAVAPGESGLLLEPGETEAFVAAVLSVTSDPDLRRRLSAGARAQAERFSVTTMATRTLEAYREALARAG